MAEEESRCMSFMLLINTKNLQEYPFFKKKKAMEPGDKLMWVGFEKNVSILESKVKLIITILFAWYFSLHLASILQFSFSFIFWIGSLVRWLSKGYVVWTASYCFCLFINQHLKTIDLWKQNKTFAFLVSDMCALISVSNAKYI